MDPYYVDSTGGSDSAGGRVTIADLQARGSVAADMRALMGCLTELGDRFNNTVTNFQQMDAEREARRAVLTPQMRSFKQLDAEGKLASVDKMFREISIEVTQLSCTSDNYLRWMLRFQQSVNGAKQAVAKLEARMNKEMDAQAAALITGLERQIAANTCWVEVYDKDPYDKTAVRLRCGYISQADDMLEGLCRLLPLEEWDRVYCCSPGQYWNSTTIFGYHDKHKMRMEVEDILEARNKLVFHNDSEDDKLQLVIVRR
jgi:hypothetical protein